MNNRSSLFTSSVGMTLCVVLLVMLGACAKRPALPQADGSAAQRYWDAYMAVCTAASAQHSPYRIQISLRYTAADQSRRVTAVLWGNDNTHTRLDVNAGIGVTVASVEEDASRFMVYAPQEKKAYVYQGRQKPLLQLGVPIPLGVAHLSALLLGQYAAVFGTEYHGVPVAGKNGISYPLPDTGLTGTLEINAQGLPVAWTQSITTHGAWHMLIEYADEAQPRPYKITMTHSGGKKAIILVKNCQNLTVPFTPEQMRLTLPANTPLLPLVKGTTTQW